MNSGVMLIVLLSVLHHLNKLVASTIKSLKELYLMTPKFFYEVRW
jgi:hypothetical protein